MSRHVVDVIPVEKSAHYEIEQQTEELTGEGEFHWEPLTIFLTGKVATFQSRSEAKKRAKSYTRDNGKSTRVVKVTG